MIRQKMDSLSFELLSRMAHMMTRMTHMTRWLAGSQFVETHFIWACFGVLHLF